MVGAGARAGTVRLVLFVILLALAAMGGGASRLDVPALIVLQPAAIALAVIALLIDPARLRALPRAPALLLAALAGLMLLQLIPLPPAIWTALPGRAPLAEVAALAGFPQPWRPISMAPDLTLASLAGLSVPAAALILFDARSATASTVALWALIGCVALSALLGAAQIAGGQDSPFYLYAVTNRGSAVGLLANRNHQAVLLACAFPVIATLIALRPDRLRAPWVGPAILAVATVLLFPIVVLTGSRAGIALAIVGMAFAVAQLPGHMLAPVRRGLGAHRWLVLGGGVVVVAIAAGLLAQTEAGRRLIGTSLGGEMRFSRLPRLLQIARDHLPFGTGFGVFDPIYRSYELPAELTPRYYNHAHSDPVELLITAGLPGLALAGIAAWWWAGRARTAFRRRDAGVIFPRLGVAVSVILLLSSLIDYPLRTPLLSLVLVVALCWLAGEGKARGRIAAKDHVRRRGGSFSNVVSQS